MTPEHPERLLSIPFDVSKRLLWSTLKKVTMVSGALFTGIILSGCTTDTSRTGNAGTSITRPSQTSGAAVDEKNDFQSAAADAASQPLRDVGMMKKKIPPALARISDPYAPPSGPGCQWIRYEISQLDEALGGDVAVAAGPDDRTVAEKSGTLARNTASETIRGIGSLLIPQRGLVRKLTGADRADRLYKEAAERGLVRRGYLRGLAEARRCP